jgi:uncharacterized membrane protein (DUF373 family)
MERLLKIFERGVLHAAQILLMLVILAAVWQLWYLFATAIREHLQDLSSIPLLTAAVQRGFGGVLLVVLGLELLETLRVYYTEHRVRLEIILVVATIAVSRHVINLDFDQIHGAELAGIAGLILALTGGYYVVKRAGNGPGA